jgi:alpha-soluble NSF attachment protein
MTQKSAQQLEIEAEKKTKGFLFFKATSSDYEEAAELYGIAANKYKINRQFIESGKAYEKAAHCLELGKSACFEIANQLLEASKVYKSVSYDGLKEIYC